MCNTMWLLPTPSSHPEHQILPKGNLILGPNHMLHCSIPFITSLVSPEQWKAALCKPHADCFFFLIDNLQPVAYRCYLLTVNNGSPKGGMLASQAFISQPWRSITLTKVFVFCCCCIWKKKKSYFSLSPEDPIHFQGLRMAYTNYVFRSICYSQTYQSTKRRKSISEIRALRLVHSFLHHTRPGWMVPWVTWCSSWSSSWQPCPWQGLELDDLWGPLQPKPSYSCMILWLQLRERL